MIQRETIDLKLKIIIFRKVIFEVKFSVGFPFYKIKQSEKTD